MWIGERSLLRFVNYVQSNALYASLTCFSLSDVSQQITDFLTFLAVSPDAIHFFMQMPS